MLSAFHGGEWTAGVSHAGGDAVGVGALLSWTERLDSPDLFAFGNGDAVNVHPLEGWSNFGWVAVDVFPVAVAGALTGGTVGQFFAAWVDKCDWLDVFIVAPIALDGDDHVIVVDGVGVVLRMSSLALSVLNRFSLASGQI